MINKFILMSIFFTVLPLKAESNIFTDYFYKTMSEVANPELWPEPSFKNSIADKSLKPVVQLYAARIVKDKGVSWNKCAATVIEKNKIVTAKHCLTSDDQPFAYGFLRIDNPNRRNEVSVDQVMEWYSNAKSDSSIFRIVNKEYTYGIFPTHDEDIYKTLGVHRASDDIAILEVEGNVGLQTGYIKPLFDKSVLANRSLNYTMTGYPRNANNKGDELVKYSSGPVCKVSLELNNTIFTNCVPNNGISGGPLLLKVKGEYHIVGVNSAPAWLRDMGIFGSKYTGLEFIINKL